MSAVALAGAASRLGVDVSGVGLKGPPRIEVRGMTKGFGGNTVLDRSPSRSNRARCTRCSAKMAQARARSSNA